jgi:hypothetical protein
MVKILAYIFCTILACLTVFQILLIIGLPLGKFAWGGYNEVLPIGLRLGSVSSIFIYLFFSLIILQKAKIINYFKNPKIPNYGIWFIVGYSFLGILVNLGSRSSGERIVMTPVVTVLAILSLTIAIKTRRKT